MRIVIGMRAASCPMLASRAAERLPYALVRLEGTSIHRALRLIVERPRHHSEHLLERCEVTRGTRLDYRLHAMIARDERRIDAPHRIAPCAGIDLVRRQAVAPA